MVKVTAVFVPFWRTIVPASASAPVNEPPFPLSEMVVDPSVPLEAVSPATLAVCATDGVACSADTPTCSSVVPADVEVMAIPEVPTVVVTPSCCEMAVARLPRLSPFTVKVEPLAVPAPEPDATPVPITNVTGLAPGTPALERTTLPVTISPAVLATALPKPRVPVALPPVAPAVPAVKARLMGVAETVEVPTVNCPDPSAPASARLCVPSPLVMTVAVTLLSAPLMAVANVDSESIAEVIAIVTAGELPDWRVIDWPWVSSSLAAVPVRLMVPPVLEELGARPAETRPPEI